MNLSKSDNEKFKYRQVNSNSRFHQNCLSIKAKKNCQIKLKIAPFTKVLRNPLTIKDSAGFPCQMGRPKKILHCPAQAWPKKKIVTLPRSSPARNINFYISQAKCWAGQPGESLLTINSKMPTIKQKWIFRVCLVHKRIRIFFTENLVKLPILLTASLMFKVFEVIDCLMLW